MVQPLFMKLLGMNMTYVVWQSLTLQNGGFFHIAMGAVLGVAAWTRGQEKLAKTK
jgi:K+ transporter